MKSIDYLKLQAKNLHRDFRTQKPYTDSSLGENLFEYSPKHFDIDAIITDFNLNEQSFTLMNAQHVIANLAGFRKWNDLVKVNEAAQELGKLMSNSKLNRRSFNDLFEKLDIEDDNRSHHFKSRLILKYTYNSAGSWKICYPKLL